jgi:hypothetical protein
VRELVPGMAAKAWYGTTVVMSCRQGFAVVGQRMDLDMPPGRFGVEFLEAMRVQAAAQGIEHSALGVDFFVFMQVRGGSWSGVARRGEGPSPLTVGMWRLAAAG